MNRDFEIRQLLRAFRSGIMSEQAFEEEMTRLEHESGQPDQAVSPGFSIFGRSYRSEREAVLSFLDELHANQLDSAIAYAKWSAICAARELRTGLLMAAERAAVHARIIQRRVNELGGELRATATQHGSKLVELLANAGISDTEKLAALGSLIREPQQLAAPLLGFAEALKRDLETKQALRLIAEDELSTATWLHDMCAALDATEAASAASEATRE
jgi:hypothetical protein